MSNEPVREYYSNGAIQREQYCTGDHRDDGPAHTEWHINGQKKYEAYSINGEYHREDGPARTWWYENAQKYSEEYWVNGSFHRTDGPADIVWDEDGNITEQTFRLNGNPATAYDVFGDTPEAFAWVMANE